MSKSCPKRTLLIELSKACCELCGLSNVECTYEVAQDCKIYRIINQLEKL